MPTELPLPYCLYYVLRPIKTVMVHHVVYRIRNNEETARLEWLYDWNGYIS